VSATFSLYAVEVKDRFCRGILVVYDKLVDIEHIVEAAEVDTTVPVEELVLLNDILQGNSSMQCSKLGGRLDGGVLRRGNVNDFGRQNLLSYQCDLCRQRILIVEGHQHRPRHIHEVSIDVQGTG
jgi:hypothetical protein